MIPDRYHFLLPFDSLVELGNELLPSLSVFSKAYTRGVWIFPSATGFANEKFISKHLGIYNFNVQVSSW